MKIKVTNCNDCPFYSYDDSEGSYCSCPESDVSPFQLTFEINEPAPKNCPLQNDKVTIELI